METDTGWCVARACLAAQSVDLPVLVQAARDDESLTADFQGPDDSLIAKIRRHVDSENAPVAAWLKVAWLSLVRRARFHIVVRTNRDLQRFFEVAVEVTEGKTIGPVLIPVPAFESGGNGLTLPAVWCQRHLRDTHE